LPLGAGLAIVRRGHARWYGGAELCELGLAGAEGLIAEACLTAIIGGRISARVQYG